MGKELSEMTLEELWDLFPISLFFEHLDNSYRLVSLSIFGKCFENNVLFIFIYDALFINNVCITEK